MLLMHGLEMALCFPGSFLCTALPFRVYASSLAAGAIIVRGMVPGLAGSPARVLRDPPYRFSVMAFQLQGIDN
jgi:hypothetical protein